MTLNKEHLIGHPIYNVLISHCQLEVGILDEITSIEAIEVDDNKFRIRYRYTNLNDKLNRFSNTSLYKKWDYQNWAVIPESHELYNYIKKEVKSILRDVNLTKIGI